MRKIRCKIAFYVCLALMLITLCSAVAFLFNGRLAMSAFAEERNVEYVITEDGDYEEGSIIIVLKSESSKFRGVSNNLIKKLSSIGVKSIEDLSELPTQYVNEDGTINYSAAPYLAEHYANSSFKQILYVTLQEKSQKSVIDAIAKVEKFPEVEYVGPNWAQDAGDFVPNDTFYPDQWSLRTSGGINVETAWDITRSVDTVRVGIIDSGIATHNDLNAHVQTGYDFYNRNTITNDPLGGHGTHVAGIVGAIGNNSLGISGVAPNITLVPLQTAHDTSGGGSHYTNERLEAIKFATGLWEDENQRISILNHSIGGFGTNTDIAAAAGNFPGLFVWSAGNNGQDTDTMSEIKKFNLPNVISVGALTSSEDIASYSNYGLDSVNIYAPGDNILSTYPQRLCTGITRHTRWGVFLDCECEWTNEHNAAGTWEWVPNGSRHHADGYHFMSGTSMAAPHVTGVAALLLSKTPMLTGGYLKKAILENADDITINTPGGKQNVKKLNAFKALESLDGDASHYYFVIEEINVRASAATFLTGVTLNYKDSYQYTAAEYNTWTEYSFDGKNIIQQDTRGFTAWMMCLDGVDGYDPDTNPWIEFSHDRTLTFNVAQIISNYYSYYKEFQNIHFRAVYKEATSSGSGGGGCVAEGTLITLANGEQVPVEQLTGDETLLVWNLFTGTFDTAPILCIDRDSLGTYEVINLYFSDDTQVKVISEHGFWDFDLNKYVYLDANAAEYIGHWFNKQTANENGEFSWASVQLTDVIIQEEYTAAYSPVTYSHLCYYVNGMLSMPGGIDGLFNIFDVDSQTMTYNSKAMAEDIEQYGLFTYEEFAEILPVPEEIFEAVNGQYLKVAIGKGLIDLDTIARYINQYSRLFD